MLAGRCLAYGEGTTYRALADIVRGLGDDPRGADRGAARRRRAGDPRASLARRACPTSPRSPTRRRGRCGACSSASRAIARSSSRSRTSTGRSPCCWTCSTTSSRCRAARRSSSCASRGPSCSSRRPRWAAPQPRPRRSSCSTRSATPRRARARRAPRRASELAAADRAAGRGQPAVRRAARGRRARRRRAAGQPPCRARGAHRPPRRRRSGCCCSARPSRDARFTRARSRRCCPTPSGARWQRFLAGLARKGLVGGDRAAVPRRGRVSLRSRAHPRRRLRGRAEAPARRPACRRRRLARARPQAADEIVGFHFEQACPAPRRAGPLRRARARAAPRARSSASRRRRARSAHAATRRRPARCSSARSRRSTRTPAERAELLPELGAALLRSGPHDRGVRACSTRRSRRRPSPTCRRVREVEREFVRLETEPSQGTEQRAARRGGGDATSSTATRRRTASSARGRCAPRPRGRRAKSAAPTTRGARPRERARRAGDDRDALRRPRLARDGRGARPAAGRRGDRSLRVVSRPRHREPRREMWTINPLALLHAMKGDFALAEQLLGEAGETRAEARTARAIPSPITRPRSAARRPARARRGRAAHGRRAALGDGRQQTARHDDRDARTSRLRTRRLEEADALCRETADAAAADDIVSQVHLAQRPGEAPRPRRPRRRGRAARARGDRAGRADRLLSHHGDAMVDLAEVLQMSARPAEAQERCTMRSRSTRPRATLAAAGNARAAAGAGDATHPPEG